MVRVLCPKGQVSQKWCRRVSLRIVLIYDKGYVSNVVVLFGGIPT